MVRHSHRAGLVQPRSDRRHFVSAIVGGAATLGTMAASGAILGAGVGAIADSKHPLTGALEGAAIGGLGGAGGFELGLGGAAAGTAADAGAATSALGGTSNLSALAPDIMDSTQAAIGGGAADTVAGTGGASALGGAASSATGMPVAAASNGLSIGGASDLGSVAGTGGAGSMYIDPLAGGATGMGGASNTALGQAGLLGGVPKSALALGALSAGAQMLGKSLSPPPPSIPTPNPTALNPYYNTPLMVPTQPRMPATAVPQPPTPPIPGAAPPAASPPAQPSSAWGYNYGAVPFSDPWAFNQNGVHMARGGALEMAARQPVFDSAHGRYVQGPGDGQSDSIPAYLSDGEFVLDAHDVSTIGGGSNAAGARKLEQFRNKLHKDAGHQKKFLPKGLGDGALTALARRVG